MSHDKESRAISRREFVKRATVGAVAVTGAGALTGCGSEATVAPTAPATSSVAQATTAPAAATENWDLEADVVVVGSGNGGLTAGITAAQEGAEVIIVEISSTTGGGSCYSGGNIHCEGLENNEEYLEFTQRLHDYVLSKVYIDNFPQYSNWVKEIGASVSPDPREGHELDMIMGNGEPHPENGRAYFDSLVKIFKDAGGTIMVKTRALNLMTDEDGQVIGIRAKGPDGIIKIKGKAVILACGGFQSNPEMRMKYFGFEADLATVMGTPYNMGDGMRMAQEVGAAFSGSMSTMSGSMYPAHPHRNPQVDVDTYEKGTFVAGPESKGAFYYYYCKVPRPNGFIMVNLDGKRFVDENAGYPRYQNPVLQQPQAMGIIILDETLYSPGHDVPYKGFSPDEILESIVENGGYVVTADSIEELADKLQELPTPVHKANFIKTITEYNQAVEAGTGPELEVARTGGAVQIATPPFYAIPSTVGIYACFGGVSINEKAQVLDTQHEPIPGLYACPPTAGGIMRNIYTGMIACAGTFGRIAGKHAAAL
ncbi:MAG: FAD-binding protein [Anaerolineales bacterium]|nr:FAD-binding protein [Anaerolineales bacterium]